MPDDRKVVALLKFFWLKGTVTRPEIGRMLGRKGPGYIAGICRRNKIAPWPTVSKETRRNRTCQFPTKELPKGEFVQCGARTEPEHPHVCKRHRQLAWPLKEELPEDPSVL